MPAQGEPVLQQRPQLGSDLRKHAFVNAFCFLGRAEVGPLGSLVPMTETFKGSVPSEANPDSRIFWKASSPFVVPHVSFLVVRCCFPGPRMEVSGTFYKSRVDREYQTSDWRSLSDGRGQGLD